jgi:hypothetical protein
MLGTAVKNFIIVLLLVLIAHFLIRNTLLERSPSLEPFPTAAPLATKQTHKAADREEAMELFQWAYSSPPPAKPQQHEEEVEESCVPKPIAEDVFKKSQRSDGRPPVEQRLKGASIINEYNNESAMNGGAVFAGLHGYEGSETRWSNLADAGAPLLPKGAKLACGGKA